MEFVVGPAFDPITDFCGTRTIFEDEDGNLFDENMKQIEI